MSAAEIAARFDVSELHVHRTCEKLGIPKRDEHGRIKKGDAGLTRYSICEWEEARKISTRTITNAGTEGRDMIGVGRRG
jgi:hypothetical protein